MILGFLRFDENTQKQQLANPVRCGNCYYLIEETSESCMYCGVFRSFQQPKSWLERFKRWLGIEISSDLIVLSIEEPKSFFTEAEIDSILDFKKMKILALEDVPNWNLMFYNTKRITRPRKRRIPINRQITNHRAEPKLLAGKQDNKELEKRIVSRTVTVKTREHYALG